MKKLTIMTLVGSLLSACAQFDSTLFHHGPKPRPLSALQNPAPLKVVQQFSSAFRPSASDPVKMSPFIIENTLVLSDHAGSIRLFDLKTNQYIWQIKLSGGLETLPNFSDDMKQLVFIDNNHDLQVVDRSNHRTLFKKHLLDEHYLQPQLKKDLIVTKTLSGDLEVYSLQKNVLQWRYVSTVDDVMVRATSKPFIKDNRLIAGFSDGRVIAFNLKRGNVLWEQSLTDLKTDLEVSEWFDIVADPIGDLNTVYVASFDGQIAALDIQTGAKRWQQSIGAQKNFSQTKEALYVFDKKDSLYALDKVTGRILWQQTDFQYRELSSPVISENTIVFYDAMGYVHALSTKTGKVVSRLHLSKPLVESEMAAMANHVFISVANGTVFDILIA